MPSKSKAAAADNRFSLTRADASEQIAYEIRRHIERQGLQPGDRIGTEQELAAEFGVSRPTLREALRLLAGSHLIRASQGRGGGIFVAHTAGEGMGRHMSEAIGAMLATESVSL
jgi:GntR family transcriptional regulator, transcriptional repressor for pyruvate dehydrogenase complex